MKYVKQMIADFLRKLIKLDDYIDDRVFTEIDKLNDYIEEHRTDLDDRPNFYDMESQVEELVNNEMADVIERLEKLEDKDENW